MHADPRDPSACTKVESAQCAHTSRIAQRLDVWLLCGPGDRGLGLWAGGGPSGRAAPSLNSRG